MNKLVIPVVYKIVGAFALWRRFDSVQIFSTDLTYLLLQVFWIRTPLTCVVVSNKQDIKILNSFMTSAVWFIFKMSYVEIAKQRTESASLPGKTHFITFVFLPYILCLLCKGLNYLMPTKAHILYLVSLPYVLCLRCWGWKWLMHVKALVSAFWNFFSQACEILKVLKCIFL
jgi:hypothetical protein